MFSIIISTIHDIDALRPIFLSSSKEVEVIIIDSSYSEEKKQELKQIHHNYKKVVYAPPKKRTLLTYSYLNGNNTGLAYSEEPWCFCIGDNWELKPDFFSRLTETIELFVSMYKNNFVVRPLELEPNNNDVRWVSYVRFKQRYIFLPCAPLGSNGLRQYLPIITCGAIVAHKDTWYQLNGFDERYDIGAGWYDNDVFDKFVVLRYPIILDQQLMTYRILHKSSAPQGKDECKKLYDDTHEIRWKGSVYSPNDFDLRHLHDLLIKDKEKYVL